LYEEVHDNNIPELLPENQSIIYDETVKSVRNDLYEEQQLVEITYDETVKSVRNDLYEEQQLLGESQKNMTNNGNEATNNTYSSLNQFSPPFESEQIYCDPGSSTGSIYQQLSNTKYRELNRQNIQISTNLRSGEFSRVNQGVWNAPWGSVDVAIKTLNDKAREEEKVLFLREAAIMGQFHHPNIVKMHGVVTVGEPMMIVLELMTQGDLRQYLQQYQPIPGELAVATLPSLLLEFSKQISSGMNYLSSKKFIHRDLAARNILVTDNAICKIGDFGMSRDLLDDNYYISHAKKIPIKWTAPEALHFKRYSTASDVWSYGAVLYEIWSVGHKPFENYSNQEVTHQT
jgi:ephrin-B